MARDWRSRADELAVAAYGRGAPTAWFDQLYAEGASGVTGMPWDREAPHPVLASWVEANALDGTSQRAVVVGCGLGADAEYLAGRGFATMGFDLSRHAIEEARRRYPQSSVDYHVADLLTLPARWRAAFDLVVEVFTLQAVPDPPRAAAAAAVRSLPAVGGRLLLVGFRDDGTTPADEGPPFRLSEDFVTGMARDGLELASLEPVDGPLWRAVYERRS